MSIEDLIGRRGFRDARDSVYTGHTQEGQDRAVLAGELQQAGLQGLDSNDFDTVPSPGGKHYRERPLVNWQRFDVTIALNADAMLGFMAHSAIIDNTTSQWAYVKSARDYIPPSTFGKVIHFPMGTQKHEIIWESPPGIPQAGNNLGSLLSITYLEKELAPSPGSFFRIAASGSGVTSVTAAGLLTSSGGNTPQISLTPGTNKQALAMVGVTPTWGAIVNSLVAGTGITLSGATGDVTINATGGGGVATSGTAPFAITGAAGAVTALLVNPSTETGLLADFQLAGVSVFSIDTGGIKFPAGSGLGPTQIQALNFASYAGITTKFLAGGLFNQLEGPVFGLKDIFFQGTPIANTSYTVLEAYTSAGLMLGTGGNTSPIRFYTNRVQRWSMINTGQFYPANDAAAAQVIAGLFAGSGAPSNANGNNGDYYFRGDTPATALQRLYIKSAGTWIGII